MVFSLCERPEIREREIRGKCPKRSEITVQSGTKDNSVSPKRSEIDFPKARQVD